MEKKVIALIRTSTVQQEVESQKQEVLSLILSDGYTLDEVEIVGNKGASAIKIDEAYQNNMNKVYELIEKIPSIKAVYAWSIDRIGRNEEILFKLKNFLAQKKIQLVIKNPSLRLLEDDGTVNAGVELAFSLFATMAKQEMEQRKARFNRAKKRNAEAGKANRGLQIPFGYTINEESYFVINEEEADIIRLIFELHNTGKYSLNKLANELNERGYLHRGKKFKALFLRSVITSTLTTGYSDIYIKRTNWKVRRNYPQIISKEQHDLAVQILKQNQKYSYKGTKHYYFGAKLLYCESCRHYYVTNGREYACLYHKSKLAFEQQGMETCDNNTSMDVNIFDGILWSFAREKYLNFLLKERKATAKNNLKQIAINNQKIDSYKNEMVKFEEKRVKINDDYYDNKITSKEREKYLKLNVENKEKVGNAIVQLENENRQLQFQLETIAGLSDDAVAKLALSLFDMDDEKKMFGIVHDYIKRATIHRCETNKKKCYIVNIYFQDGTSEAVHYFPHFKKQKTFKREKAIAKLKGVFIDDEGYSYIPCEFPRIERIKGVEGKIKSTQSSSIRIPQYKTDVLKIIPADMVGTDKQ